MVAAEGGGSIRSDRARHFMTGLYERFGLSFASTRGRRAVSMRCRRLLLDEADCGGKREEMREGRPAAGRTDDMIAATRPSCYWFVHLEY